MKWIVGCAAAVAVASVGACTGADDKAVSLNGKWAGTITCYNMDMPLTMTVDAAAPARAALTKGDQATVSWDAALSIVDGVVTIKSDGPNDGAETLAGKLQSDVISGTMDKQLCTAFKLTRHP